MDIKILLELIKCNVREKNCLSLVCLTDLCRSYVSNIMALWYRGFYDLDTYRPHYHLVLLFYGTVFS